MTLTRSSSQAATCLTINPSKEGSGAETILGQGGQDRERQSSEREIKFFAEIGLFLPQKQVL